MAFQSEGSLSLGVRSRVLRSQGEKIAGVLFASLLWAATIKSEFGIFPDEVDSISTYREGAVCQVSVNAYERNPKARQKCIEITAQAALFATSPVCWNSVVTLKAFIDIENNAMTTDIPISLAKVLEQEIG